MPATSSVPEFHCSLILMLHAAAHAVHMLLYVQLQQREQQQQQPKRRRPQQYHQQHHQQQQQQYQASEHDFAHDFQSPMLRHTHRGLNSLLIVTHQPLDGIDLIFAEVRERTTKREGQDSL